MSDGFTAKCIFFVSPFFFALMLFLVFDVLVLDGSIKTYEIYTMNSYPYCSCTQTHTQTHSLAFDESTVCRTSCVNNATCMYTTTVFSDPIEGTGTCHFYGPDNCTETVCTDPFLVSGDVEHSTLSIKALESKIEKL